MATTFYPLPEAAAKLGISQSALRRRVRAGTAQAERRPHAGGFAWHVACEEPQAPPRVGAQEEHLADLRRRVDDQAREIAELHRLLMQAHQLALTARPPAPAPNPDPPETQSAPPVGDQAGRSWRRRLWGWAG